MDFADLGVLIIAGGQSSRMGQDKRFLELDNSSLLEWQLRKTERQPFKERYLCGGHEDNEELQRLCQQYELEFVPDSREAAGPLEGLRAGLARLQTDYALAVSCDMPLFRYPVLKPLLDAVQGEWAVIPVAGGRRQPLAGIYHRKILPQVEAALASGEYKIGKIIDAVPHKFVEIADKDVFFNVNTPADYRLMEGRFANLRRDVPLVTIAAPVSNTGKTTFIEQLLPRLREHGLRVGVVKGDCHGYNVDETGKDSWRFKEAGAQAVAVVSPEGYFIQQQTAKRAPLAAVANRLENVDIVLIESRNHGVLPKISLWRGLGDVLVDTETVALFSSGGPEALPIRQYDLDDIDGAVRLILFLCGHQAV
ncbi:molybdopterin-guanine dinucleotide biosynthesis protein [Selenomonas ruminantium]|uniref:Probable molybdenum cofactor guanylyltransferase n=1 Tax=Selenomonas ruminantium TaxID=971 RepID=A0A1M6TLT9_SELRU|nr:molybdopterin-guanine dinucleotide biosynthesis protein B [Selenomonas ruminantium]SHK57748.1 molybdopterin-guanine dinucleotide biosynthesis protein [Selenomonas ruminantium]